MSDTLQRFLTTALHQAIADACADQALGSLQSDQIPGLKLVIEIPNDTQYGDYASPSALGMAKLCRKAPAQIAQTLAEYLQKAVPDVVVSVAGAGFINFRLQPAFLQRGLQQLLGQGDRFGQSQDPQPDKVLLEFVSANPTGPLHVGHGRWAAVGSTLANLLRWTGHEVEREFYINDAGNQMNLLGQSLQVRLRQVQGETVELPEDAYWGTYLLDIAQKLWERIQSGGIPALTTTQAFTDYAYREILAWQQDTLHRFSTDFDQWYSERRLHEMDPTLGTSAIQRTLAELQEKGYLYTAKAPQGEDPKPDAEEALYFKSSELGGDDKDRVVKKGDGSLTYLAADIAYHRDKVSRGYSRLINILGSDHHGYVARLKAGVAAFSPQVELEAIIGQFVKLFQTDPESGEKTEVRMSKRTGNFVSVNDLMDDPEIGVGVDAARWFLLSMSMDSPLNFDLDLARDHLSLDNPVVYAHYSHARCCTLLRRLQEEKGLDLSQSETLLNADGELLFTEPEERALLMLLLSFPDQVITAATERAVHKLIKYTEQVASQFNKFYDRCRIHPTLESDPPLALARLQLVKATRQVLFNVLTGLLGISAPESM